MVGRVQARDDFGSKASTVGPMRSGLLRRKCACGGTPGLDGECAGCRRERLLGRRPGAPIRDQPSTTPPVVQEVLSSPGRPLDPDTRDLVEPRFGHDFGRVRLHTDARAAESARSVDALAYTVGTDVVFGPGQYAPRTPSGLRLLAHELAHVVQQAPAPAGGVVARAGFDGLAEPEARGRAGGGRAAETTMGELTARDRPPARELILQRQAMHPAQATMDDPRLYPTGAPKAVSCAVPSHCPVGFCQPYSSESYAVAQRTKLLLVLMAGIAAAVDGRVVPLWREHLLGGSAPKNLTGQFAKDFTDSKTTEATTHFLLAAMRRSLAATPPTLPVGTAAVTEDFAGRLAPELREIDDPIGFNQMNFNIPKEVPGNLAGGIGKNQMACAAGAKPSPFNDERRALVTANITQGPPGQFLVQPSIVFTVKDTIDLCPGDCGTSLEQIATVPISQFEATGISGDVPFSVEFPAPPALLLPFTLGVPSSP
jgi:hypothetical protein